MILDLSKETELSTSYRSNYSSVDFSLLKRQSETDNLLIYGKIKINSDTSENEVNKMLDHMKQCVYEIWWNESYQELGVD